MGRENSYRLIILMELLLKETDGENELSMQDILEKLKLSIPGVSFDKRTIKDDLEILDESGFEIVRNKGKYGKILYSHQGRIFETYQLRLIIDAILSARFITEKEKSLLIKQVKQLTSVHIGKTLPEPLIFSQSANLDYEMVKLNIDKVHQAISTKQKLHYKYGKYNLKKEFEYSRDGATYIVEPYALIWQNDYYYLIGRFVETDEIRHYRLDRIRDVEVSDKRFKREDFQLQGYVNRSFHMFAGEEIWMKVRFHASLVNVVLDRFGRDVDLRPEQDEEHFILNTKAKLSTGLVNWLLTWGEKAKVLEPNLLVDEVKIQVEKMYEMYRE